MVKTGQFTTRCKGDRVIAQKRQKPPQRVAQKRDIAVCSIKIQLLSKKKYATKFL